jgi:peptidoglycan/xylan/chitin deacetylase (PgdA/CDA1 family)
MYMRFFLAIWLISFLQCDPKNNSDKHVAKQWQPGKEVPVLCYHNIRMMLDHHSPELTVTEKTFDDQIKTLYDNGYHTILPDDLYNYLTKGSPLPPKPIMISFDDSHEEHFSIAARELEKYGFKGVFFVMTIAIDKPHYLSRQEIYDLAKAGHTIACHTYDHPLLTHLPGNEWTKEIDKPRELLAQITGKPVDYFAYPYGAWDERAVDELKKRGIKAAFQLSEQQNSVDPLYSIRRVMVSDAWSTAKLEDEIHSVFNRRNLTALTKTDQTLLKKSKGKHG